ncbi:DUF192 domain-containing protein [Pacificimonas sp. WHA3]|uniref:DUF192 domain-containing protein n=1 Tax=Pacificimonas pallii TaxID=2827236 RepID=A0ABS6SGJ0_9SPHN|nr:DUF192 domain-containing protein [Pacificimonas pallii]MBV7257543.1 DUF192 domain-containing protein [Pacificimonas pallii]
MITAIRAAGAAMVLAVIAPAACAPAEDTSAATTAKVVDVSIETASGPQAYRAEVARTPEEQARGLMFRQDMAQNAGMLFPYDPPRPAAFWMKNTYIPLDIIFIAPDGTIESIHADTLPLTTSSYASRGAVKAVLELNGGEAARIGAKPGDRVVYQPVL